MDIVEFAEKVLDLDLLDYQKKFLTKTTDFNQYLEKKAENEPYEVAELICLKCFNRAIHAYHQKTLLKHLHCQCGEVGYLIKTGQTLEEVEE